VVKAAHHFFHYYLCR